jgi:hypothetical protein
MTIAHGFDALVMVPNCDKNVPGLLMAAARLNIPTVFVSGGPMLAGRVNGKKRSLSSMFEAVGAYKAGKLDECGLSEFESHGNEVACKKCGKTITYGEDKTLTGKGFSFPFRFMNDWYEYQKDFVNALDVTTMTEASVYCDRARMSEVILNKRKNLLRKDAELRLYGDRVVVDEGTENAVTFWFSEATAVTVLGRNKLNIYCDKKVLQFKGSKRFNALKYVNFYHRYKNITRGNEDGKFLGL